MQGVTEERFATNHLAKHLYKHVFASTRFSLQKKTAKPLAISFRINFLFTNLDKFCSY